MQFLKTLFWVVVAVAAVVFATNNWTAVTINLWSDLIVEAKLPVLIAIAFLVGFVPTFAVHKTTRWRLRRRVDAHERALADLRGIEPLPAPTAPQLAEPALMPAACPAPASAEAER